MKGRTFGFQPVIILGDSKQFLFFKCHLSSMKNICFAQYATDVITALSCKSHHGQYIIRGGFFFLQI